MYDTQGFTTELDPEVDDFEYADDSEFANGSEDEAAIDDAEEMTLAAELLDVADDAELDRFLGDLIRRAGRTARSFVRTPTGQALRGVLRGAARRALPHLGRAVGSYFGGASGGRIGARVASQAGRIFGLEVEGLSPEDQDFEVARRFVRFATDATRRAARSSVAGSPGSAARRAIAAAAHRHAPGLVVNSGGLVAPPRARASGQWIRRGRNIILIGA